MICDCKIPIGTILELAVGKLSDGRDWVKSIYVTPTYNRDDGVTVETPRNVTFHYELDDLLLLSNLKRAITR